MRYRLATYSDIDLLVSQRMKFINVDENHDMYNEIKHNCYSYFYKAFTEDTCDVILTEDKKKCVGIGIVFYYDSVPSIANIAGENAYITGLYVEPGYRRRGIGKCIVEKLLDVAMARGYKTIMLNASDMGKVVYRKIGFTEIHNGMILDIRNDYKKIINYDWMERSLCV